VSGIENDDFFNIGNGVVAGAGTGDDPYIIENWAIEVSTAHGIWVKNTTAYFIIRNCLVENGGLNFYHGIYLENVVNGKVENCACGNNLYGIYLHDSPDNNTITNNTCENNYHGIYLCYSSNNTITNNTCENNIWYGIALYPYTSNNTLDNNTCSSNAYGIYLRFWSENNTVVNNSCSSNAYGIGLSSSDNNILDNNICSNNFRGIYLEKSGDIIMWNNILSNNQYNFGVTGTTISHFVHDIDPSNLVNGKPIRYLVDNKDEVIGPLLDVGYLALVNCENTRVENLAFRNNEQGILLASTDNSWVENCVLENNFCGAYLYSSNNNFIFHNNFLGNENQTHDDGSNYWDGGYLLGGNYWSDYAGEDNYRGENQDIPGGDGIGDTPYYIPGGSNVDRYPFMNPWSPIGGVQVSISPSKDNGPSGTTLNYEVTVINTGNVPDNYLLENKDNLGWTLKLDNNWIRDVMPREDRQITLSVTIPENVAPGVEDNVTITATSQADPIISDNANCIALSVAVNRGIDVSVSPSQRSGVPGATLEYLVTVTNIGNVGDNYDLIVEDDASWGLTLANNPLENIGPGKSRATTLSVTIPDNENLIWVKDNIIVTATSQADNTVSDNDSCIAHAIPENTLLLVAGWNLVGFVIENTPNNIFTGLEYYTDYYIYYYIPTGYVGYDEWHTSG